MLQGCKKLLTASALLLLAFPSIATDLSAGLSVSLPQQSLRLDYNQPTRLEQVLKDTRKQASNQQHQLESLQAQLFDVNKQPQIESQKREVLAQLQQLNLEEPTIGADKLIAQINAAEFKYREFTSLDYDVVQSQLKRNPLLDGQYQLNMATRDPHLYFFGAVKQVEQPLHRSQWFLADYFKVLGQLRLDSASTSLALVIQPDGHINTAHYGNWNLKPHFIAPGATVFVPFDSLPSQYASLNQEIAQLLRHKVMNNNE
ncbi:capsule biosynthesis GfcC family protein [Vibrio methylphosphonaticus]|uniref:capsule biosynthesis GfcC family protein n=1 Tax=Vibrio methylphosphonaticus TaxID=2946866 RepID=UPI002029B5C4|nr:capsule biosynthesis GfcC family protein [Vibrio methylphosphonaticus]MCL9775452.1 capsule biosynthesis GfcC family protein [Vibrio methylphosphonaticus]